MECGGDYIYLSNGIKSCMEVKKQHDYKRYEHISDHINQLIELTKN